MSGSVFMQISQVVAVVVAPVVRRGVVARCECDAESPVRFNRQLHLEEKTLAKQLAARSKGKYTQAQIEDQMRIMGAPATLVGQIGIWSCCACGNGDRSCGRWGVATS
ncbi:hypothetical protein [Burkholderia paludis]|uniref:hypothetical protein n=1 Tax=Burkholderia paludis TaxID=1506587 RepID=UPI00126A28A4|nr:hypothetical protein [Burkholderia paludis]